MWLSSLVPRRKYRIGATCLFSICLVLVNQGLAEKTAADYFVRSLPGAPPGPLLKMHAGHVEISPEHHGNLFFWLYQNRHIANKQRLVIWACQIHPFASETNNFSSLTGDRDAAQKTGH
ncbi:Protease [Blumeria graminis f. sp. tritici 96224]|uniref:Protease n=1 Tax=Blumeria graminis f. sp. tritici 96224 TaxID=1268274 RepID=A0A656KQ34_BLUGR|nr:Protease [Blumeria graminis f. sp. tritici 96224]